MTDLNFEPKRPEHLASDVHNDVFRAAFGTIARAVIPWLEPIDQSYPCDMLWDALNSTRMAVGDEAFVVVTGTGTHWIYAAEYIETLDRLRRVGVRCRVSIHLTRASLLRFTATHTVIDG